MARGTCRYSLECKPLVYSKWPSRSAPVSRSTRTTSSCVGNRCMFRSSVFLVRPVTDKYPGNGAQDDFPIERQRPIINVLHIQAHPRLEVQIVAAADRP